MKRKIFSTVFSLVFLISVITLAGCGSSSSSSEGASDSKSKDNITVDIFNYKVEIKDQLVDATKQFEKENPGVKFNVTTVGGGAAWTASLKSQFASGKEPAIFPVGGPSQVEEYRDSLADVSDTESAKVALDGTLNGVKDGEEILGLPYNQEGYGLIYNKEIFKKAGINPDEILTFSDLEKAVETLDKQKDKLGIDAVFAFPVKETWVTGNHLANAFIAPEFNNNIVEAYKSESIAFKKSEEIKRFIDLQNKYSIQPTLSLDYSQQVEQYFSLQKVAMIQQGNWVFSTINEIDPDFAKNDIGIFPIPVEGYEGSFPVGVPMYWGVNKNLDEKVVQTAKDFLDWLNTSEAGKKVVTEEFKFMPAYEGYDSSSISDNLSRTIYESASETKTIGWVFRGGPVGWHEEILGPTIQKYVAGEVSWDELIDSTRKEWEKIRK